MTYQAPLIVSIFRAAGVREKEREESPRRRPRRVVVVVLLPFSARFDTAFTTRLIMSGNVCLISYTSCMDHVLTPMLCFQRLLYGRQHSWPAFHAVNDTVRGGASISHWSVDSSSNVATFSGHLDITKLGGAGFASQATSYDQGRPQDWSSYDGLRLTVSLPRSYADKQPSVFTISLKDTPSSDRGDGRNASRPTFEWQFDGRNYTSAGQSNTEQHEEKVDAQYRQIELAANWNEFKRTYRGREQDGPGLDTSKVNE